MFNTHPNFKSLVPNITDVGLIKYYLLERVLCYQNNFKKITTPWELQEWNYNELQDFVINLEEVDRLYYIYRNDYTFNGIYYEMIVRMHYNNNIIYVHLMAFCFHFMYYRGHLYISQDPYIIKSILQNKKNQNSLKFYIYKPFKDNIYDIGKEIKKKYIPLLKKKNIPLLKILCLNTIYRYKYLLEYKYKYLLPICIVKDIDKYIDIKDAISHYFNHIFHFYINIFYNIY